MREYMNNKIKKFSKMFKRWQKKNIVWKWSHFFSFFRNSLLPNNCWACTRWIVNYCLSCRFVLSIDYYLLVFLKRYDLTGFVVYVYACFLSSSSFCANANKLWTGQGMSWLWYKNFLYYFALKPLTNSLSHRLVSVF